MNDHDERQATGGPAFSEDTFADKAIRFGCGAILAALAFTALVLSGLGEPLGLSAVVAGGIVIVLGCGVLSVALGERYLERLLRLIKWLG